jgi:hypothetical protein
MSKGARKLLTADQIDSLGFALIEMAKELWVMKDRQMITEALLRDKNLLPDLDAYQPGPDLTSRIAQERQKFLTALTSILFDAGA